MTAGRRVRPVRGRPGSRAPGRAGGARGADGRRAGLARSSAVSRSGETIDTLMAVQEARQSGGRVRGIVNAVGSSIAREADGGIQTHLRGKRPGNGAIDAD